VENLVAIEGAAPPGGGAPLGWPDESWREYSEHSLDHDQLPGEPETRHAYAAMCRREHARVTVPTEADLAWARARFPGLARREISSPCLT
jgi:hypothetical protein